MEKMVRGYKSFLPDRKSIDGKIYQEGMEYRTNDFVRVQKGGYHFCTLLEDTLLWFQTTLAPLGVEIAEVTGSGIIDEADDKYCDMHWVMDTYASEKLKIERFLTREEIIDYGLSLQPYRRNRFLSRIALTFDEFLLFYEKLEDYEIDQLDFYHKSHLNLLNQDSKIENIKMLKLGNRR